MTTRRIRIIRIIRRIQTKKQKKQQQEQQEQHNKKNNNKKNNNNNDDDDDDNKNDDDDNKNDNDDDDDDNNNSSNNNKSNNNIKKWEAAQTSEISRKSRSPAPVQKRFWVVQRLLGDLSSLGPKDLSLTALTTFGAFLFRAIFQVHGLPILSFWFAQMGFSVEQHFGWYSTASWFLIQPAKYSHGAVGEQIPFVWVLVDEGGFCPLLWKSAPPRVLFICSFLQWGRSNLVDPAAWPKPGLLNRPWEKQQNREFTKSVLPVFGYRQSFLRFSAFLGFSWVDLVGGPIHGWTHCYPQDT